MMAVMYPSSLEGYRHTRSEAMLYDAMRESLPDTVSVFFSVSWYYSESGLRVNSEADFIVLDPSQGFLVIEVKGGKALVRHGDEWRIIEGSDTGWDDVESLKTASRVLKRSPFAQAEESMRFVKSYFEDRTGREFPGIYGYACAFPFYSVPSSVGPEAPKDLVIDYNDMDRLAHRVNELFHYWRGASRRFAFMTPEICEQFVEMIHRRTAIANVVGAAIVDHRARFDVVNRVQRNYLEFIAMYRQALVVGGAGTGKTYLAMRKAMELAREGHRVLLLCYNVSLCRFISHHMAEHRDRVDVSTFTMLMRDKLGHSEISSLLKQDPRLPGVFDRLARVTKGGEYDAIIIDEAQDFTDEWALCARLLLRDEASGWFYVFYDEDQNIFQRASDNTFEISNPPFMLCENLRNTAQIHSFAVEQTGLGRCSRPSALNGPKPQVTTFSRVREARRRLASILTELITKEQVPADSICVLSDRLIERSFLLGDPEVGAAHLVDADRGAGPGEVRFRTVQGFKGLESDVVVFLNHRRPIESPSERMNRYVAHTRARYLLYVIEFTSDLD